MFKILSKLFKSGSVENTESLDYTYFFKYMGLYSWLEKNYPDILKEFEK